MSDLRDSIVSAIQEHSEEEEQISSSHDMQTSSISENIDDTSVSEDKSSFSRSRDELGRFTKENSDIEQVLGQEKQPIVNEDKTIEEEPIKPSITVKVPQSLKEDMKGIWDKLDPTWQLEIDRLEREARKQIDSKGYLANIGSSLLEEMKPYEQIIKSEGGTPQTVVRNLLNTAYQLRVGTPAQKQHLLLKIAQDFGIDTNFENLQPIQQPDHNVQILQQEILNLKEQQQRYFQQREQAEMAELTNVLSQFAADPKHKYFEQVRNDMAIQLETGAVRTLEEAYARACWASPAIRNEFAADPKHKYFEQVRNDMAIQLETGAVSTLEEAYERACWTSPAIRNELVKEHAAQVTAQRRAEEQKRVEQAKAAAASIKGSPMPGSQSGPKDSLRSEIIAAFRSGGNRI